MFQRGNVRGQQLVPSLRRRRRGRDDNSDSSGLEGL